MQMKDIRGNYIVKLTHIVVWHRMQGYGVQMVCLESLYSSTITLVTRSQFESTK